SGIPARSRGLYPTYYRSAFASSELSYPLHHHPPLRLGYRLSGYRFGGTQRAYPVVDREAANWTVGVCAPVGIVHVAVPKHREQTYPTYLLVTAYQPLLPCMRHEALSDSSSGSTFQSFPSPRPHRGSQSAEHCPQSFRHRITPLPVR